ncbi:hypothetical protein AVEN_85321-1 [Araneus ventricosus]|uniref:Mos1 transposase HTH domain-containing protein n=1 Tax=Araneus ventricosus TaxID=182803 RepID=A0A4Y2L921_ARAVE|nr:hypothetical protein AVEN_85321-1 [Araneus ventricosus]
MYLVLPLLAQFDFNCYVFKVIKEVKKEHIWHILLYEFKRTNKVTESLRNIWRLDSKRNQCQLSSQKFRVENYSLANNPLPVRSIEFYENFQQTLWNKTSSQLWKN